jgi:hypothetical protein
LPGTIDWDAAMMSTQKIGYDGIFILESADTGDPVDVLKRSVKARERLDKDLRHFLNVETHEGHEAHEVNSLEQTLFVPFVSFVVQKAAWPGVRGNGITSRMLAMPVA